MADAACGPDPPGKECPLCPRLVAYREANRAAEPSWHNAPVPSFGRRDARLLIVGMAPGLRGANRTGRPFTGDYAGVLLYETLMTTGLAVGVYGAAADDGLELRDCRICNAVRCAPPANLPTPAETRTCNAFLKTEIDSMDRLTTILALGVLAHAAIIRASGLRPSSMRFAHGAEQELRPGVSLFASYHVSRYNTSTRRLTTAMFLDVVTRIRERLDQ